MAVAWLDGTAAQTITVSIHDAAEPIAAGSGGFKRIREAWDDGAAFAVSGVGDPNGDSRPDLLVGAALNGNTGSSRDNGTACLIY